MSDWGRIGAAIANLERLQQTLAEIVNERGEGWRLELVRRRRDISELIGLIATLFDEVDRVGTLDTQSILALRAKLSDFRAALAMHQASYPAVTITADTPDYKTSINQVRATSAVFCELTRRTLKIG